MPSNNTNSTIRHNQCQYQQHFDQAHKELHKSWRSNICKNKRIEKLTNENEVIRKKQREYETTSIFNLPNVPSETPSDIDLEQRLSELRGPIDDDLKLKDDDTSRKLTQDIAIHSIDDIQVTIEKLQARSEEYKFQIQDPLKENYENKVLMKNQEEYEITSIFNPPNVPTETPSNINLEGRLSELRKPIDDDTSRKLTQDIAINPSQLKDENEELPKKK